MKTIYPILKYDDAHAAIDFLERAFGCERSAGARGRRTAASLTPSSAAATCS